MFANFSDYLFQILSWCQSNCLYFNYNSIKIKHNMVNKNDELVPDDDWLDYGFGEYEIIH